MRLELCLPLALLFLASGVPSEALKAERELELEVAEGEPLALRCELRPEQRAAWRLDGRAPPPDLRAAERPAPGGVAAELRAAAARAQHAGRYTCAPGAPAVRVRVRPAPAPAGEAGEAAGASETSEPGVPLTPYTFELGGHFSLNCSLPLPTDGQSFVWKKNGTAVEQLGDLKDRYKLEEGGAVLRLSARALEDDYGNYTCALAGVGGEARGWALRAAPVARLPADTNVVEGQRLKLECRVLGKPAPAVLWTFSNASVNATDVRLALGARALLRRSEAGVEGGELVLEAAARADAGVLACVPAGEGGRAASTTLRVKDMYAALWPFLGICAEVLVLCAVILVYERRRTKPELDDSDTDNHDQKKS